MFGTKTNLLLVVSIALNFYFIQKRLHTHMFNNEDESLVKVVHRSPYDVKTSAVDTERTRTETAPTEPSLHVFTGNVSVNISTKQETASPSLRPAETHTNEHHLLVVAVMSSPDNLDRRDAIRKTWKNGYKKEKNQYNYVKFVVGTKNLSTEHVESLKKENSEHEDLLLLTDFIDSYTLLTRKLLATLSWFDQNVNYSYLLKCDDDSFVLLDKLDSELVERDHSRGLYWGYLSPAARRYKKGPWAEPIWRFCDTYFPYALGGGYILSSGVVHRIVSSTLPLVLYNNEDVTVGAWTVVYDMERKHDIRFNTNAMNGSCKDSYLISHKETVNDMLSMDKLYRNHGKLCTRQKVVRSEYLYRWGVLPSKARKWIGVLVPRKRMKVPNPMDPI